MAESVEETRLTVRRTIPARREKVFDAWLDAEGMRTWMAPGMAQGATAEIEPRVGGAFRIVMHGTDRDYDHRGVYRVLDRPSKIVFTWVSDGTNRRESLVTIELHERGEETEVVLTHEGLPDRKRTEDHAEGWTRIVELLAKHLAPK